AAALPTPARASAGGPRGADSRRRCHAHTAAATSSPSRRRAAPIPRSHLAEWRRTSALAPHLRDARDVPTRRHGGLRGPPQCAVAAPTSVAAVLGLHRVRSTARIDPCP